MTADRMKTSRANRESLAVEVAVFIGTDAAPTLDALLQALRERAP
jgi:hypothetical protein